MENVIFGKSQAMKAGMEKPYVCILVEGFLQLNQATLEIALAKSLDEAKNIFRSLPISCLIVPLYFNGKSIKSFLEWFRRNFPKVLIVPYGKRFPENGLWLQQDANIIHLTSYRPQHVLEVVVQVLKERTFKIDLKAVRPEDKCSPWANKTFKYLLEDNKFLHVRSVQEIANHFGVTVPHLLRNFNSDFPFSLKQFLLLAKLCYATWLKDTTTLTVEAIASHCGFADGSHLSHVVCKFLGMPLSYFLISHSWPEVFPRIIDRFNKKSINRGGQENLDQD